MLIRIPTTFRAANLPATVTLNKNDVGELLEEIPGQIKVLKDEFSIHFDSPRAASDFVERLKGRIPYLAADMDLNEEILFNALLKDKQYRTPSSREIKDKKARGFGVAGLTIGISSAVASIAALVLSIVALVV